MQIRSATLDDARWMAGRLRHADEREIRDGSGKIPSVALRSALFASKGMSYVVEHAGKPVILYGVAPCPVNEGVGSVWLMATQEVRHVAKSFLQASSRILEAFHGAYPGGLYAIADTRNTTHIRWLRSAGFILHDTHSVNGVHFVIATHV